MKLPITVCVLTCLFCAANGDAERWVWPSDAKKSSSTDGGGGGISILGDVDPRVTYGAKRLGRMIFPESTRYAEPQSAASSSVRFQSSAEGVDGTRQAKRLELESSPNSLRKPAVVGRVKNFPHGGGYSPDVSSEYQQPPTAILSSQENLPTPITDQGLDPSEWLNQHGYSRGASAAEQIPPYSSSSQEQQAQDVVLSLGNDYLINPGSLLDDDSSLESVYYTGSGGAYENSPQLPYYIHANPDYTYGGGCKEGHQYHLVDENQNPLEGFNQQGNPQAWDLQEAKSAYLNAAQRLNDPAYASSSSYTHVHAGQPISFDSTDGKNCEDCSAGWEPMPYDILSVNSGEHPYYQHEQQRDPQEQRHRYQHEQHIDPQQHLQETADILQGLYPKVITVPTHINIIPEPYFVDTDVLRKSRRKYGRKLTGPAPVYTPNNIDNSEDLSPVYHDVPAAAAQDKRFTVEVQSEVTPVVKLQDESINDESPFRVAEDPPATSTLTSVVVSSDQEESLLDLRTSLPKTDFASFRDKTENASSTVEKSQQTLPRRTIYRRRPSPAASTTATSEQSPFVAPVTVDGYVAQGSQYNTERVPLGSTEADRPQQEEEDVRIVSFIPPQAEYNVAAGASDAGADATLKRSVATVSHGSNGKVFLQSKTIKLECEIPFCTKGVLKWTLYPSTENQISARSSDGAVKNGIELEEDDITRRRPGTAKTSVLYLGENPAITEAQARSFEPNQGAHPVSSGVYQCEVIKCGDSDFSPVESFLIK